MSASFYDLLKYAKTGIAAPDMTAYDKMRAVAMAGGGSIKTLTSVPPLSFRANGKPLISWSMLGNGVQNGTPAPDAPITPTFCGERTENLFDVADVTIGYHIDQNGKLAPYPARMATSVPIDVSNISYVTLSYATTLQAMPSWIYALWDGDTLVARVTAKANGDSIDVSGGKSLYIAFYAAQSIQVTTENIYNIMLNLGSTILPYEPYGYKFPITCAGQTTPVYLGQTQTVRRIKKLVLTGEETNWIYEGEYERFGIPVYDMFVRGTRLVTLICSHYQCIDDGRTIENVSNNSIYVVGGLTNMIFIKTNSYTTADAFKNYLQEQCSNGTPVTVWYVLATPTTGIVNEPLAKIGSYADELHSADAGVSIPTARGQNTLTVDTDLQPSSMTITYR